MTVVRRSATETPPLAVLLDYNGTLSSDEHLIAQLYVNVLASANIRIDSAWYFGVAAGLADVELVDEAARHAGRSLTIRERDRLVALKVKRYCAAVREQPTVPSEARAFVGALARAGVPLAIVSAAPRAEIEAGLDAAGLAAKLPTVIAVEDVTDPKPSPDGYLRAVRELGLDRTHVLAIEDSRTGLAAARAAQLSTVAVRGTVPDDELELLADRVVDRLDAQLAAELLEPGWRGLPDARTLPDP